MTRIIRLALLCWLAFAASEGIASACSCAMRPVCASFWEVDRVFTGRAEVTASGKGWQTTRFRVEESFRGPAGTVEIVSRGIGGSCAYAFVHGTRYLVYTRRAPDGTWSAMYCDPTAPVDQAAEGFAFARGIARDTRRGGQLWIGVGCRTRPRRPHQIHFGAGRRHDYSARGAARILRPNGFTRAVRAQRHCTRRLRGRSLLAGNCRDESSEDRDQGTGGLRHACRERRQKTVTVIDVGQDFLSLPSPDASRPEEDRCRRPRRQLRFSSFAELPSRTRSEYRCGLAPVSRWPSPGRRACSSSRGTAPPPR